jgi:cellulose synthase operon protein B
MNNRFSEQKQPNRPRRRLTRLRLLLLSGLACLTGLVVVVTQSVQFSPAIAQGVQKQEDQLIQDFKLPDPAPQAPVYRPEPAAPAPEPAPVEAAPPASAEPSAPEPEPQLATPTDSAPAQTAPTDAAPASPVTTPPASATATQPEKPELSTGPNSRYILEFNRSPVVGNRFRLEGTYAEARLGFTRPRNWKMKSAKAMIHFQHSPALVASKSNLVVRVNDVGVGSVPLNLKQAQTGEVMVNVPAKLIQDYNEITVVAQQQNSATCSTLDKTLWTEVLPDSKLVFDYQPQAIPLDFSRYPYPFFDELGLDKTRISYLLPSQVSEPWLTTAARLQAQFGRLAEFRSIDTQLVSDLKRFQWNDRLFIIGTPEEQPLLKTLKLPFKIAGNKWIDKDKTPLPDDRGILMMTTLGQGGTPVLVASANSSEGVAKAVQFLLQSPTNQLGTGQFVVVNELADLSSPKPRDWPRHLPNRDTFNLSDLRTLNNKSFKDVTVRGTAAPPVEFHFSALPDDRFLRGNSMTLDYSYSAQLDPRASTVEVLLDEVGIGSKKLSSDSGASHETYNITLPEKLIKPDSKIQVAFRLYPKDAGTCGGVGNDQQLSGTVHGSTSFNLKRENSVQLPDLKLLTVGYPFAAPQDLSQTAIVLPTTPSNTDVMTLLKVSERLGRLSRANSIKFNVYKAGSLPEPIKKERHLVAIGTREQFPFPEIFKDKPGFSLLPFFGRQQGSDRIQALPDTGGVIKSVISPWNPKRVILALSSQIDAGLKQVQDVLGNDPWFYQLREDTVLVSTTQKDPSPDDSSAYQLQFLQQVEQRRVENTGVLNKISRFLQERWFLLPTGIVTLALILYGIAQLYLKRVAGETK